MTANDDAGQRRRDFYSLNLYGCATEIGGFTEIQKNITLASCVCTSCELMAMPAISIKL